MSKIATVAQNQGAIAANKTSETQYKHSISTKTAASSVKQQ
jgi:hypothetical protein